MAHPRNKHESKLVKKQRGHRGRKCYCYSSKGWCKYIDVRIFYSLDKKRVRKFKRRNRATAARFADEGIVRGPSYSSWPRRGSLGTKQVRDPLPMLK